MRITPDNISEYLLNGENDMLEFKRSIPSNFGIIERLVSAFANTKGGSVIFGYDELKKIIVGVDPNQVNKLKDKFEDSQYGCKCKVYTIDVDDKLVAILDVEKGKADVYVKGVAYIRREGEVYSKVGNIRSKYLKEFIDEIQNRNRNPRNIKVLELLNDLSTNPERVLLPGDHLYRCRIIHDMTKMGKEPSFYGYGKKDSFVPPASATRDMRANYRYIPYLYCANHPYTALVEVRPRLGANVSVATIAVHRKLTLLDFTMQTIPHKMSEAKLNLFAGFIHAFL